MTLVSKNVYTAKLNDLVSKYNNTYHSTIKMKPTYIDTSKEINMKNPKCKIDDIVRISKYKNIFWKGYTENWLEEAFMIKQVKKYCVLNICY